MTDNEILLAMSDMLEPIKTDIQEIKVKLGVTDNKLQSLEESMDNKLQILEESMNHRLRKIELTQENEILPRLRTIEACYTSTYDRYKDSVEDLDMLKQDVFILKDVVTEHSRKLQKIS